MLFRDIFYYHLSYLIAGINDQNDVKTEVAMLTSSNNTGQSTSVPGSRIPVAKHRQNSPEQYNNHNNYQTSQSQHVSRLPKYQFSPTSQHEPSATSSGGSSTGSGESEGESTFIKRRKDSSGSISGLHGMPGNIRE